MTSIVPRRSFLAVGALAVPSLALGGMPRFEEHTEFQLLMKQVGKNLKAMRSPMKTLATKEEWESAAAHANTMSMLFTQAIELADQVAIPSHLVGKYGGDKAAFVRDLRIKIAQGAAETIALSVSLWKRDREAAKHGYGQIRMIRNDGHGEFQEE